MKNFQRRKKRISLAQYRLILLVLIVLIVLISWSVIGLIGKARDTFKNKNIAEDKITNLQIQKEKLLSDIEKLNTEKGVEENIREKFGLAKGEEGMIVIVDDKNWPTLF